MRQAITVSATVSCCGSKNLLCTLTAVRKEIDGLISFRTYSRSSHFFKISFMWAVPARFFCLRFAMRVLLYLDALYVWVYRKVVKS